MKHVFYVVDEGDGVNSLCEVVLAPGKVDAYLEAVGGIEVPPDQPLPAFVEDGVVYPAEDYSLAAVPLPCTITIEGVEYECHEQPVFEFDAPGTYVIKVDAGPRYLKKVFNYDYQA